MRQDNIEILMNTLAVLENGRYVADGEEKTLKLSKKEMTEAVVYLPDRVHDLPIGHTASRGDRMISIRCKNMDAFDLARESAEEFPTAPEDAHPSVLVLNLANAIHPGGGVRRGAKAQEEDLCRRSSLLLSLESDAASDFYTYNYSVENTYAGTDAVIITPKVEILMDASGRPLSDSVIVSVMTCAAPMIPQGVNGLSKSEYLAMLRSRIDGMLGVAASLGYSVVVLGAFGCGAFHNDAAVVAKVFAEAMREFTYEGKCLEEVFSRIDFAVMDHSYNQYNFDNFSRYFDDYYREREKR